MTLITALSDTVRDMMVNDGRLVDLLINNEVNISELMSEICESSSHDDSALNSTQLAYKVTCVYRDLSFELGVGKFLKHCANAVTNGVNSLEDMTSIVENVSGYYSEISCEFGFFQQWKDLIREWEITT